MYPILFQLDGLTIYAYGFFLTLGIVVAGILAILKVRKEGLPISFERAAELFFYAVLSAIVGSRVLFYDAANGLAIFLFLTWKKKRKAFDGQIFFLFFLLYSITRFFIEMLRGDPRGFIYQDLISTSQGIGILLAITSLFMLFFLKKQYRR